jgi:hypothetical protein
MSQPKAKLYQRLRKKGFPWVVCEVAKNGSPLPDGNAFQFGIRYTINGQRVLDTADTIDEAVTLFKATKVPLYAKQKGNKTPAWQKQRPRRAEQTDSGRHHQAEITA